MPKMVQLENFRAWHQLLIDLAQKPGLLLQGSVAACTDENQQLQSCNRNNTGHRQVVKPIPQGTAYVSDVPSHHLISYCLPGHVPLSLTPTLPHPGQKTSLVPFVPIALLGTCQLQWPALASPFLLLREHGMWVGLVYTWLTHQTWAGCDTVTWTLVSGIRPQKELRARLSQEAFFVGAFPVKR